MPNKFDTIFSNGHWAKTARTVGEVIRELQRLPPDMPVHSDSEESVDLVVFNRNTESLSIVTHVGFEPGGSWDEAWDNEEPSDAPA